MPSVYKPFNAVVLAHNPAGYQAQNPCLMPGRTLPKISEPRTGPTVSKQAEACPSIHAICSQVGMALLACVEFDGACDAFLFFAAYTRGMP